MSHPTATDYARAEQMLGPYRARRIPRVEPQWMRAGERFWYRVGAEYVIVDPGSGSRRPAFDHDRLAAALSVASGRAVTATDLPITAVDPDDTGKVPGTVRFVAFASWWVWNDRTGAVRKSTEALPAPGEVVSPDGTWAAFRKDGDIHVRSRDRDREIALTDDAQPDHDYGSMPDPLSYRTLLRSFGAEPLWSILWSPDSTRLLVHRLDQRHLPEQVLVESAPPDGSRPREHRYRFPMPGDAAQATMTWAVLDLETGGVVRERGEPTTVMHATAMYYRWWSGKGDAVHLLHQSRNARTVALRRLDPATGETTTLITETGRSRVDPAPQLGDPAMVHVLDSGEILWWSQRDGWGHLYRYPHAGADPVQVTSGPWQVRSVLWVDQEQRQVWFVAAGLVDSDPYLRQICRVGLDGTGFTRLTDDLLDHDAVSPPQGGYLLDRASRPDTPPRARVLDGDGGVLVEIESPGTGELEALGWSAPERFRALAADGRTSVFGLLWRPHDFDPDRRYPVIDHVYPGPQVYRAGPSFDPPHHGEPEALAALGFAVVALDGRGTAGRDKPFHDHSYGDLGNAGALDDHVSAIRQLGLRHPWLDTDRVGITGHSAGGYAATRALLAYPDFFRVGVAVAGNQDPGSHLPMWVEHYHGATDDESLRAISNPALAGALTGHLLLIHGELDDVVHPTQALRLIDALIEADKDVDLLLVPGGDHALLHRMPYVLRRTWDYFVRHLHGVTPPPYRLAPLPPPV